MKNFVKLNRKKKLRYIFLLLLFVQAGWAQEIITLNGRYGLVSEKVVVIEPQYDRITMEEDVENFCRVYLDGKCTYAYQGSPWLMGEFYEALEFLKPPLEDDYKAGFFMKYKQNGCWGLALFEAFENPYIPGNTIRPTYIPRIQNLVLYNVRYDEMFAEKTSPYFTTRSNKLYGLLGKNFELTPQYDTVPIYRGAGLYYARKNGKWGLLQLRPDNYNQEMVWSGPFAADSWQQLGRLTAHFGFNCSDHDYCQWYIYTVLAGDTLHLNKTLNSYSLPGHARIIPNDKNGYFIHDTSFYYFPVAGNDSLFYIEKIPRTEPFQSFYLKPARFVKTFVLNKGQTQLVKIFEEKEGSSYCAFSFKTVYGGENSNIDMVMELKKSNKTGYDYVFYTPGGIELQKLHTQETVNFINKDDNAGKHKSILEFEQMDESVRPYKRKVLFTYHVQSGKFEVHKKGKNK